MNNTLKNLIVLAQNAHIRYPALVIMVLQIVKIWMPNYKDQLEDMCKLFEIYIFGAAANAPASTDTTNKQEKDK